MQLITAGLFVCVLAACATAPVPTQPSILAAEQAIQAAERARVLDAASPELSLARDKLQAAHKAATEEQPIKAQQLAEEARVQAELSIAKASAAKAKTVNDDMKSSNSTLNSEMQRNLREQP